MRDILSRVVLLVAACAFVGVGASDVLAQTQQLNRTLERKFPEGECPFDTPFLGTFVTDTGFIKLTIVTTLDTGGGGGVQVVGFNQYVDDIAIIEAAEFAAHNDENNDGCYFDGPPFVPIYTGNLTGNAAVPFYEPFLPLSSPCPWDLTHGAAITAAGQDGDIVLEFVGPGDASGTVSTSVIISGLTIGTPYVLHGNWSADGFQLPDACEPGTLCVQVTIDDVPEGCTPLPVRETTWGKVKSLYRN
jgi:hypothetical protein